MIRERRGDERTRSETAENHRPLWARFLNHLTNPDPLILLYHELQPPASASRSDPTGDGIPFSAFERQLILVSRCRKIVSVDEIASRLQRGESGRDLAAVTFDDGLDSVRSVALPLLERLSIPATVFLTTCVFDSELMWRDQIRVLGEQDLVERFLAFASPLVTEFRAMTPTAFVRQSKNPEVVGSKTVLQLLERFWRHEQLDPATLSTRRYMELSFLKTLRSDVLQVGNHGHRHLMLSTLSDSEQVDEIERAEEYLNELHVGRSQLFSFPFGGPDSYNRDSLGLLLSRGYRGFLLSRACRPAISGDAEQKFVGLGRTIPLRSVSGLALQWAKQRGKRAGTIQNH